MPGTVGKTAKRLLVWLAMAALVIIFGMTGVPEIANFTQSSALKVGKQRLSATDLSQELTQQITALRSRTGESLTQEEALERGLGAEVITILTQRALVDADSRNLTITAPESAIRDYLNENPSFRNEATGKFDRTVLDNILRGNNMSVAAFRDIIGQELRRSQLASAIGGPVATDNPVVKSLLLRESELRDVSFVRLSADSLPALPAPTAEDLQAIYDQNIGKFTSEEYRTFDLAIVNSAAFADSLEISEDDLRALYALKQTQYDTPETRTLRQLPFSSEQEAALALDRLNGGASFGILAAERGQTLEDVTFENVTADSLPDAAVADALFGARGTGGYLGPIKTLFGYTVAEVISVTPGRKQSFDDVRDAIRDGEIAEITGDRILDVVDVIELARDEGAGLEESLADVPEVALTRIGPLDQSGVDKTGVRSATVAEVLAEVFLLEEGEESLALDLADGGYFIVRIDEIEPAALKPFETVKEEVRRLWRGEELQKRLDAKAAALVEAVEAGGNFEDVAEDNGLQIEKATLSPAVTDVFPYAVIEQIFNAHLNRIIRPASEDPEEIILAMTTSARFEQKPGLENLERLYKENYTAQLGQELYGAYYKTLERELGVTQNQGQIAAAFNQAR